MIDRYCVRCRVVDVRIDELLRAIANQEVGREPAVYHACYFVNLRRQTIFHLYDDRGLDVVASRKEALQDVYSAYNDWILDSARERIQAMFQA